NPSTATAASTREGTGPCSSNRTVGAARTGYRAAYPWSARRRRLDPAVDAGHGPAAGVPGGIVARPVARIRRAPVARRPGGHRRGHRVLGHRRGTVPTGRDAATRSRPG